MTTVVNISKGAPPAAPGGREWLGKFTAVELSNEAYHAAPGISKTHLDTIDGGSPRHYWQRYINPERPIEIKTPALVLGDAIHAAILQPSVFESRYAPMPEGLDRRTKEGKATWAQFVHDNTGKTHLTHDQFVCAQRARDTIYKHPIAGGLFRGGVAEHSFFVNDAETGALIKCRPDYMTDDYVVDLKSTLDAGEDPFSYDATKLRYDVAVPWYLDIIKAATATGRERKWIWVAIEKVEPFAVGIYYAQRHDIFAARDAARRNLHTIIKHRQLNSWPDYGEKMLPLNFKPWKKR